MNHEFNPSHHEKRIHNPESYRALGRTAAGDVGAFPAINMEDEGATQPIHIPEFANNRRDGGNNDRPERIYRGGLTNVSSKELEAAAARRQRKLDEDTQPNRIPAQEDFNRLAGPQTTASSPDQFRNPDGSFNREAYIRFHSHHR